MNHRFDFDTPIHRCGSNCVKWDECDDSEVIPMWVADMDFATAPCIIEAMRRRVEHGAFGYNIVPESYYRAIIDWHTRRHGWTPRREWIQYTIGVVPALSVIVKALASEGDAVLIQTPVYNCFFSSIRNNGCRVVEMPLTWHPDTERYTVDFALMEQTIIEQHVKVFLLCNPHNPACRVWTRDELNRMADICQRHSVVVVADEIHCEFVNPDLGYAYTPFGLVAEARGMDYVVANAASKAFNIAGLQMAYIISPSAEMRARIDRAINVNEVCDVNPFGIIALEAAYSSEGEEWLNHLLRYIYDNYQLFRSMMKAALPALPIAQLDGTYLAWVDVSSLSTDSKAIASDLKARHKVWVNPGEMYGQAGFLRVNLACPRSQVEEATRRIIEGLKSSPM
ncbi:MAG: pyridoxal phosphate-dependent aminotransferase [Bacteroidaceae bacterium]|nr:pyridoxal phosphate-dependent aminotransferase [Bacteroidaceae bacterium]